MASWKCETCGISLEADDEGVAEVCPRCGQEMSSFRNKRNCSLRQEQERQQMERETSPNFG